MSTQVQTQTQANPVLKLRGEHDNISKGLEDLERQGYAVVKGVLSEERAAHYRDALYTWLESFNLGFKRDDPSTWKWEHLPKSSKGGLYNRCSFYFDELKVRYGVGHEQFVWDLRTEEALIEVFARIWGTDELLVSFGMLTNVMKMSSLADGSNVSLPMSAEQRALATNDYKPWPHTDQSGLRRYKHCIQGIANFAENGPEDGGLAVLKGSIALWNEFLEAHDHEQPPGGWDSHDSFHITEAQQQWFYDRGCEWEKVCAGPGDVLLWDSRCVHQGTPPTVNGGTRMASYVCYKPASLITPEKLAIRQEFARRYGQSTHDPVEGRETTAGIRVGRAEGERVAPLHPPVMSDRALQLAGLKAY